MKAGVWIGIIVLSVLQGSFVHADDSSIEEQWPSSESGQAAREVSVTSDSVQVPIAHPINVLRFHIFFGTLLLTAWGVYQWEWFTEPFNLKNEHGFSNQSSTGGADKVGHFWDTLVLSDFMHWSLRRAGHSRSRAALWGALASMIVMAWIEVGDGTSPFGFSFEDLLADALGGAMSFLMNLYPPLDALLDFRISYFPTSEYTQSGSFAADYSGMVFIMALKLAGMGPVGRSPLRFVEFHLGFYSRGFRTFDIADELVRTAYVGVGLNFNEMLQPLLPKILKKPVGVVFEYYQFPHTSWEIYGWQSVK